jgi:peptidoglycan/LPS O-acetylase OafA/YrhL
MLVLSLYLHYFTPAKFFILPPLVLLIGTASVKPIALLTEKTGDLSYGIYIYAFPIQQALMHFFNFGPFELMITSLPLSIAAGYASWHWVEKVFAIQTPGEAGSTEPLIDMLLPQHDLRF